MAEAGAAATAGPPVRVLTLPGWQSSGAGHWQTRWEALHGDRRVEQDDWQWPRRGDWMARLDEVVQELTRGPDAQPRPVALVAHSLGCHLVAAWAAHSSHAHRVVAALLVAPPDTERSDTPPQLFNWRPIVSQPLPFRSLVVASTNDPFCPFDQAARMAHDWGAALEALTGAGHINAASGLGDWPEGRAWLNALLPGPTDGTSLG